MQQPLRGLVPGMWRLKGHEPEPWVHEGAGLCSVRGAVEGWEGLDVRNRWERAGPGRGRGAEPRDVGA